MSVVYTAIVRRYMWVLMVGLLLQGIGSLLFRLIPALPSAAPLLIRGIFGIDFWHAWIHIIWGSVGVVTLALGRAEYVPVWLAFVFGIFYTALGVAGVLVYHPLGLELDVFENAFHLTAGPASLLLGAGGIFWNMREFSVVARQR